ncbi:MAG TPA: FtsX-like permease family protein, partial [Polyangiales bacterium]
YNAVSISVAQRRKEVGTLRALGVTRKSMMLLFCLEALVMAVLGTALGLFLARGLARLVLNSVHNTVDRFLVPIHASEPDITPGVLAAGLAAGLLTTLVAAFFPARSASSVDPAEALRSSRSSALSRRLPTKKLALWGLLLICIAAIPAGIGGEINGYLAGTVLMWGAPFFVPLIVKLLRRALLVPVERFAGIPGRLALDNAERALGRSAMTVVALMMAVALSLSISGYATSFETSMMAWVDNAVPADAAIVAGSPLIDRRHMPFAPDAVAKLKGTPGLVGYNPMRSISIDHHGRRMILQSSDTALLHRENVRKGKGRVLIEGPATTENALVEKPRVMISENLSSSEDVHPGDTLVLNTTTGPKPFEVHSVVVDYSSDQGWMMIDHKWFHEYWQDELSDSIDLYYAPGSDPEQVTRAVRERLGSTRDL